MTVLNTFEAPRNQIHVNLLHFRSICLSVNLSDSILSVKNQLCDQLGIIPAYQRLMFFQQELKDTDTLSSYNISNNGQIDLILRLAACYGAPKYTLR